MIRKIAEMSRTLQMAGPRNIAWRPAADAIYETARRELEVSVERSIRLAEDAHIARHGDMHGVVFRVRTVTETIAGTSPIAVLIDGPTE